MTFYLQIGISRTKNDKGENPTSNTEEVLNEMMKGQKRENNVIVYNIKGSNAISKDERITEEKNTVKNLADVNLY